MVDSEIQYSSKIQLDVDAKILMMPILMYSYVFYSYVAYSFKDSFRNVKLNVESTYMALERHTSQCTFY